MKYFIGIAVIALGIMMTIKSDSFVSAFGRSAWAEEHLGGGGTYTFYKLLGIAFVFLSLMGMTGIIEKIMLGTFGKLFGL